MSAPIHRVTPYLYSASQLNTYDLCPRKWGWEYVAGFRPPPGPAAELGIRVHKILERWLSKGIPPDKRTVEGRIALPGLEFLPLPGPSLSVEDKFVIQVGDFHYRGFKDLEFIEEETGLWIVDHKTTGDFIWQKTEDDLLHDVQAMLYAKEALDRVGVDEAMLMWLYYRTRNTPKARPTYLQVNRDQVESGFEIIHDLTAELDRVRLQVVDARELPINPNACAAFGGCPHQHRCNLSPRDKRKAIMAQAEKKESIKERMQARFNKKAKGKKNKSKPARPVAMNPPETPDEDEALSTDPPEPETDKKKDNPKKPKAKDKLKKDKPKKGKNKKDKLRPPKDKLRPPKTKSKKEESSGEATSEEKSKEKPEEKPKPEVKSPALRGELASEGFVIADAQTAYVLLHAAALAGGGYVELHAKADEIFEKIKEDF